LFFSSNSTNNPTEQEVVIRADVPQYFSDDMAGLPAREEVYAVADCEGHGHVD